jgi:hypothetical protein
VAFCKIAYEKNGPEAPATVRRSLGITYHPDEKANVIADYLENQFTSHDLCDENHERQVETTVQTVLASVDGTPLGKVRPCDILKLGNSFKWQKACVLMVFQTNVLRHLPRRPLVCLTPLFNHCLRLTHFLKLWKEAKVIMLPKPGKDPEFPRTFRLTSLLSTTGKLFEKSYSENTH